MFDSTRFTRRSPHVLACLLAALLGAPAIGIAQTVTVPDDYATIQEAHDSAADLIQVRPGNYDETLVVTRPVTIRGMVAQASWPDSLPVLDELVFDTPRGFSTHSQYTNIEDLRITKPVRNTYSNNPYTNPYTLRVFQCVLEAGLNDSQASSGGQLFYDILSCIIDGPVDLNWPETILIDSCVIRRPMGIPSIGTWRVDKVYFTNNVVKGSGPFGITIGFPINFAVVRGNSFAGYDIALLLGYGGMQIGGNVFTGPGHCAIAISEADHISIGGNLISGYEIGILHPWTSSPGAAMNEHRSLGGIYGDVLTRDNRIEDCSTIGMDIAAEWVDSLRDTILNCGAGAKLAATNRLEVERALILSCNGDGLVAQSGLVAHGEAPRVEHNVVGRCGGDGIRVVGDLPHSPFEALQLRQNTSYSNAGSGYVVSSLHNTRPAEIANNIAHGNGGFGLAVISSDSVTVGCNDWFANTAGFVDGITVGATDVSVDPQFCDLDFDNVSLVQGSPLINAAGCGLIGALGLGCGVTPVLVALLRAEPAPDGIRIEWQWGGLDSPVDQWIERASGPLGPWARIETERSEHDGITIDLDRLISPGRSYFYRLAWIGVEGNLGLSETVTATAPALGRLTLVVGPNPSPGPVNIEWSLPRDGQAHLVIFDIAGREVARVADGVFTAGSHQATWNGRTLGGSTAPGIYFVRLRYDGSETTRRILLRR